MIKLKNLINSSQNTDEYQVDDFDNIEGWNWKEVDHLIEMGFQMIGDTRLKLSDKKSFDDILNVEIFKEKSTGNYVMILNDRKHVFKSFVNMMHKIEELGQVD